MNRLPEVGVEGLSSRSPSQLRLVAGRAVPAPLGLGLLLRRGRRQGTLLKILKVPRKEGPRPSEPLSLRLSVTN